MATCEFLLLESGDYLLLEDGSSRLIIGDIPCETPSEGGASSGGRGGRPWPQRTLNILMPKRVMQDDEDILLAIDD